MYRPCARIAGLAFCWLLVAWVLPGPGQGPPEDYTRVDPEKLGVKPVPPRKDPQTGFVVGGKNPTALIRKLTRIAGRTIASLEKDMRPGAASRAGFLGKDEKLLDVMAADNVYVVEELGLTHQALARHLRIVGAIAGKQAAGGRKPTEFTYHGRKYKAVAQYARGYQESPFEEAYWQRSQPQQEFRDALWQGVLVLWLAVLGLLLASAVLGYLRRLRAPLAENLLYLQDQLWRETRGEQSLLNRWLTWARLRAQKRKEGG